MWRNNKVLKYNKVLQQQNINIKALSLSAWNIAFEEDFKQRLRSLFQVVVLVSVDIGTINICLTIYNYFTHAILYHSNSNRHRVSCMCRTSRTDNIQALQAEGCKNSSTVVYHLWACFDRSPDSSQLRSVSALFCFNGVRVFKKPWKLGVDGALSGISTWAWEHLCTLMYRTNMFVSFITRLCCVFWVQKVSSCRFSKWTTLSEL